MVLEFSVTTIEACLVQKYIKISFSLDVDEDTVNPSSVGLINKESKSAETVSYEVCGKYLYIHFANQPKVNTPYILNITKDIKAVAEQELTNTLHREIIFESAILNKANILSPCDYEEVNNLHFKIKEELHENSELINSFYLEIASDNVFYHIVLSAQIIDKNEITFKKNIIDGQYFVRARVQKDDMYGNWGNVNTFIYQHYEEENEPIYEEELEIIKLPYNGLTEKSFIIEFNDEIEIDSLRDNIVLLRSDY